MLTEDAAERGLACLRRFAQRLTGLSGAQVRAVATQTLREARNRNDFLRRAESALGHPIEVISGREEARLIYAGVAHLQPSDTPRLVIDIGGRSTEMILGQGLRSTRAESFAVGCVSLSMRHFGDGRLTASRFRAAQVAAGAELEEALTPFAPGHWREALGSSGTIGALSQALAAFGRDEGVITAANLQWLIERCLRVGHIDRIEWPGLKADRRPVLPGGLALLYTLVAQFGIERLMPARGALRQGVIIDLHERLAAAGGGTTSVSVGDRRDESVSELQRRFEVDVAQAERVRSVALALYHGVAPDDVEGQRELGWACDLHELGLMVSHHDHHRHSAYLLGNVDAPAFSQTQQRHLADIVLGQRGGLRKIEAALADHRFALQVLALRLAAIKCHARGPVDAQVLRLALDSGTVRLAMADRWAANHPRTLYLLLQEAEAWNRSGVLRLELDPSAQAALDGWAAA
jgi:exopolyphosphatase/guanosine-5'-triphosphate,3'-diphosphate pyrophosphatase